MTTPLAAPRPAPAAARLYPNFLIVGVMKAATTALSAYLNRHPHIYLPARELHFFDRDDRYAQGADDYRQSFAPGPNAVWVGEKTPTYSYHERCPERIAHFNPAMKLIWIFRNPTQRAYSHYWYFVQNGQERLSFEAALDQEPSRRQANIGFSYLDRGLYLAQIRRFLQYFPRDSMLFLLHEDFTADPQAALRTCLRFFDLPGVPEMAAGPLPENVTRLPIIPAVQQLAYQYLYHRFGAGYRLVRRLNTRRQAGYPPLPPALKARLDRFYAPHNEDFAAFTGLDISTWQ